VTPEDLFEVFERSYADRHDDPRRTRRVRAVPQRDRASVAACPARVQMGIPYCCEPCRAHDKGLCGDATIAHSEKCQARQIERGVTL
jgi:hypothetical protein